MKSILSHLFINIIPWYIETKQKRKKHQEIRKNKGGEKSKTYIFKTKYCNNSVHPVCHKNKNSEKKKKRRDNFNNKQIFGFHSLYVTVSILYSSSIYFIIY